MELEVLRPITTQDDDVQKVTRKPESPWTTKTYKLPQLTATVAGMK
jgi:hypothetical protein